MGPEFRSILVGTAGLSVAAIAAAVLTFTRAAPVAGSPALRSTIVAALVAIVAQSAHFVEEQLTGFPREFPPVVGLIPWPDDFFVGFNVFWIVVWSASCVAAARGPRAALFPLWFLSIASMANGVAHPALSLRAGGYFPGVLTSPLVGVMGIMLARQLFRATDGSAGEVSIDADQARRASVSR